jgi:hypothetical protein
MANLIFKKNVTSKAFNQRIEIMKIDIIVCALSSNSGFLHTEMQIEEDTPFCINKQYSTTFIVDLY